ncbi:PREDICTED: putative receptor-like protein kinase At1g80870 [Fragaria vesca subsp. vesca]|uniref:putative receptor-like protein kinase At1g80870 n=1 Tax=Fragaria vesca subsp. vesca TaxID=101020 RepID=UPI0002C326C7|nr:PREDICTED: putative receptor-like protein kinase At1g80870 [Fragaria vesca subsp. vesca]
MPARPFPPSSPQLPIVSPPNFFTKTRVLFLALTISASLVIISSIVYFVYHLWHSLVDRAKTIPFDSSAPLKLERFSFKELKNASNDFDSANVIGKGGSGTVFRGILKCGKLIAIKKLDALNLQTEREFQNELQILGGLRSPFLVTLLGYCVEKDFRILVYEYMPNRSLQESLFGEGVLSLGWERRFEIITDVARALEFLHLGCDPPVIHGDIKPSNILLDFDNRAKISDFGLSRIKVDGEFGVDMFSQDLGKSQELSGNFAVDTSPAIGTPVESSNEVDFALALQASSSSKNSRKCCNVKALNLNSVNYNANIACESEVKSSDAKGKEVSSVDFGGDDWNNRFVPYEDELDSIDHSKDLGFTAGSAVDEAEDAKQWGKDWWWKQDGSGELCSKDYVTEWIGSQICPSSNPDWDDDKKSIPDQKTDLDIASPVDKLENGNGPQVQQFGFGNLSKEFEKNESKGRKNRKRKPKKMQEWWKEEHLAEISKKGSNLKNLETKWKKGLKMQRFDLGRWYHFRRRKNFREQSQEKSDHIGEFSFRRGWKKKNAHSVGSDMWSGDLFSRELSSTTSMRGTLCYVAPEYGGCGYLMEKADIYSLGVLILVVVSGRRPLHVLASPMKLEKANLISWCRQLAQAGNILELVDERLKDEYNKDQASLCINLALSCLQKMPELRPDIGEIVKILKGEMDLPPLPFEFSPSPPSRLYSRSRSRRKQTTTAE